jgi:hypothetical protein
LDLDPVAALGIGVSRQNDGQDTAIEMGLHRIGIDRIGEAQRNMP